MHNPLIVWFYPAEGSQVLAKGGKASKVSFTLSAPRRRNLPHRASALSYLAFRDCASSPAVDF